MLLRTFQVTTFRKEAFWIISSLSAMGGFPFPLWIGEPSPGSRQISSPTIYVLSQQSTHGSPSYRRVATMHCSLLQERGYEIHRKWEDDGGVLVSADHC